MLEKEKETGYAFRRSTIVASTMATKEEQTASQRSTENQPGCSQGSVASPGYVPPAIVKAIKEEVKEAEKRGKDLFQQFVKMAGILEPKTAGSQFLDMNERTQAAYLDQAKTICNEVMKRLCPKDPQGLWNALIEKEKATNMIETTVQAYLEAEKPSHKRQILSLLVKSLTFQECQHHISELSLSSYYRAKTFTEECGAGSILMVDRATYVRYDARSVEHFIDYVLSLNVVSDLPFGETSIKLSTGEELAVLNVIRDSVPERIVNQYHMYCEQEIGNESLSKSFVPLKRTTLLEILDVCKASKRKALQGLDYFTAGAGSAFDTFKYITTALFDKGYISLEQKKKIFKDLNSAKNYMKTKYKAHLSHHSTIPDHCITHALSDTTNDEFSIQCQEEHQDNCKQCDQMKKVMKEIESAIEEAPLASMEKADLQFQTDNAKRDVELWKAHKLRVINQELSRRDVIEKMTAEKSVFVVVDWAMKLLPIWYREDMTKFFGKRGMSWHVAVATVKQEDGSFKTRTFLHFFEQCKQDSGGVLAILEDVFHQLKKEMPALEDIYLRADNTGCYHSAQSILTMPSIAKEAGLQIKRFDFSDPQGGKADCDRMAATVKRHINMYVAEKHNCTNGFEFVEAVESYGGIKGTSVHFGELVPINQQQEQKLKIDGISSLFDFKYEPSRKVRAWKAFRIGEGKLLKPVANGISPYKFLEKCSGKTAVEWRWLKKSLQETNRSIDRSIEEDVNAIAVDEQASTSAIVNEEMPKFQCPEEGCIKEYSHMAHLDRHIIKGNHSYNVQKIKMKDFAMKNYHIQLQDIERENMFGEFAANVEQIDQPEPALPVGWALKQAKRIGNFSEKQRQFLLDKFNEGKESSSKYTPEQVSSMMRSAITSDGEPIFGKEEFLTRNQIFSYFSRLAASKRLADDASLSNIDLVDIEREIRGSNEQETVATIHNNVRQLLSDAASTSTATIAATKPKRQSQKRCAPPSEPSKQSKRFHLDSDEETDQCSRQSRGLSNTTSAIGSATNPETNKRTTSKNQETKQTRSKQQSHLSKMLSSISNWLTNQKAAKINKRQAIEAAWHRYYEMIRKEARATCEERAACMSICSQTSSRVAVSSYTEAQSADIISQIEDNDCYATYSAALFGCPSLQMENVHMQDFYDSYQLVDNIHLPSQLLAGPICYGEAFNDSIYKGIPGHCSDFTALALPAQPSVVHQQQEVEADVHCYGDPISFFDDERGAPEQSMHFPEVPTDNPWLDRLPEVPAHNPWLDSLPNPPTEESTSAPGKKGELLPPLLADET